MNFSIKLLLEMTYLLIFISNDERKAVRFYQMLKFFVSSFAKSLFGIGLSSFF